MNIIKQKNGFTLIELLVSIAIIGLVLTAAFNINLAGWKFFNFNQDRVDLINQARLITTNLERQIRIANKVEVLDLNSDGNGELILSDGIVIFDVDTGQLIMETSSGIRNITEEVISDYNFELIDEDKGLIQFYFVFEKDNTTYEISNRFYPRAKN